MKRFVLLGWMLMVNAVFAQIAVYDIDFGRKGTSVNFAFYEEGILIADLAAGVGSLVFLRPTGGAVPRREYSISVDAAEVFVVVKRDGSGLDRHMVVRASTTEGTAVWAYLAVGSFRGPLTRKTGPRTDPEDPRLNSRHRERTRMPPFCFKKKQHLHSYPLTL